MLHLLSIFTINPGLLLGSALIASPIIIHLLAKRKFRIIDWAAMDFLIDANRQNRRRIQIEDLILLILRCLAIILLACMLARPVLKSSGIVGKVASQRIDRVIVLDDSPSMGARGNRKTSFEEAKDGLIAFVRSIAQERPGDAITLMTTSDPDRPLIAGVYANPDKAEEWAAMIAKLEVSDLPASYDKALQTVADTLRSSTTNVNRVLYVLTDLRQKDWLAGPADKSPLAAIVKDIRPRLENLLIVDLGGRRDANLAVVGLAPANKSPVLDVPTRFEVTVRNFGDADVNDVAVTFTAAGAAPIKATIPTVKARSVAVVPFTFKFTEAGATTVMAEIGADDLPADNVRYFAANIQKGVQVLVVDGEPSSEWGQSETFYVEKALAPPGDLRSGNILQVVTENQFETATLDNHQAVIVCNLYRMSEERIASLENYVKNGGGLIFFLGDQVDEAAYSGRLYRGGQGLFPVKLAGIEGDETEREWGHLSLKAVNHPVLRVYQGASNPFLSQVKIFRWWTSSIPEENATGPNAPSVLANIAYARGEHPLMVEKPFGKGRVLAVMTAADIEWSNWPSDPSFVVSTLEMVAHVAKPTSADKQLALASPLRHSLNINDYESQVTVTPPVKERATQLRGVAADDGKTMTVEYDDTRQRGFYRIGATKRGGESEQFIYAANIDSEEGDLRRADTNEIKRRLGDTQVEFATGLEQFRSSAQPSQGEIWRALLVAMAIVLGAEQFLGWWFGQRR